jgi:hypothetical protein
MITTRTPKRVRQRLDRVLGRVVGAASGEDELAAHRADVDDPSAAGAPHPREHQLAHAHEPEHVGLELRPQGWHRQRLERAGLAVAGVVDQRPDRAVLCFDRGDGGLHRALVGDVEGEGLATG